MKNEVLIIGAGASGLMAAHTLTQQGHTVTVVEARDRIGGRIHTENNLFSRPIEIGAEFMHGSQPLTRSLIKESGTKAGLLSGNRYQLWDGKLAKGDFFGDHWDVLIKKLHELETDIDIAHFLKRHFADEKFRGLRQRVKGFVEGYDAADLNRVSALALRDEWEESDESHQYRIEGGYSTLMQHLQKSIVDNGGKIILSSPVREVRWSQGKVQLVTQNGNEIAGEKLIITVPLGVLQNDVLQFSPALPHHLQSFRKMGFGGVIKLFFEFSHAFWEDKIREPLTDAAFIFSDADVPTWWSQLPDKTPLLIGWLGGPSTFDAPDAPEELFEKGIASMQYIFGHPAAEIEKFIRAWHVANWVRDPFSFGAYAYPTAENSDARRLISVPVDNTLFFAGEALYEGTAIGTVEAALVSGQAVAGNVAKKA